MGKRLPNTPRSKVSKHQCSVVGCLGKYHARGLCRLHYMRKWHTGEIFAEIPPKKKRDLTNTRFGRYTVISLAFIDNHNQSHWNCLCDCGNQRVVRGGSLWNGKTKSCGCWNKDLHKQMQGIKSNNWKGGRIKLNGYVLIRNPHHPNAAQDGYVAEHRAVMSECLGRPLRDDEVVHHRNCVRDDNRIENLELVTYHTHLGLVTCPFCRKDFAVK